MVIPSRGQGGQAVRWCGYLEQCICESLLYKSWMISDDINTS